MLRQTSIMSCIIILFIMCMKSVCSAQKDDRKCLVYEDVVTTESPIVPENITTVVFDKHLEAIIKVEYGQHVKLICDINTSSSMEIKWKGSGKTLSTDKVLDIKSVTEEYHGVYITCEVSAQSEFNILGANILISDLAPPQISKLTPSKVTVTEKDNLTLACKIVKGTPPPTINWQLKRHGADKFEDLTATGEELVIDVTSLKDNGLYQCNAKNMKGENHKPIDVTVQKMPVLKIEGPSNVTVDYGSTIQFTCLISGYPLPETRWTDGKGNKLTSKDFEINWHEKSSKLNLKTMKKSNNYSCFAKNILGEVDNDSFEVTVLSPFVVHEYPKATSKVHYSASTNIICNITSSFPMRIKWFQSAANSSEQTEIHNDKKFKITEGVLKIKSVDLDMVGKYTCEASLVSEANEKISYTTDLQIDDLAPPLMSGTTKLAVMESTDLTLSCHIDGGIPRPTVNWQAMKHGKKTYKDLDVTTEELDIKNITIDDAGKYRCLSKNAMGELNKVTEVLVKKAPTTFIAEVSAVSVAYGSNLTYTCQVVGYPLPTVKWIDVTRMASGLFQAKVINQIDTIINEHVKTSKITVDMIKSAHMFSCDAANPLGSSESSINVTVLSPFIVHEVPKDITNVHYAAAADLVCNITASFPLTIEWYHNDTKLQISDDQTVLHIKSMGLEDIGNYRCEATLVSDKSQKKEFSTDVKIDDLRAPVITFYNGDNVAVNKFEELSLTCTAHGNPQPVVTWQYQSSTVGTGETLCSTHANKQQTGLYKCIATNVAGMDSKNINVLCPSC